MTSRDFCYWLQGFFELETPENSIKEMTFQQKLLIKNHLAMVFKHEIDPSAGSPEHQQTLNEIHGAKPEALPGTTYRC